MGVLDSFKAFVHSITTDDHYASYNSPYKNRSGDAELSNALSSGGSTLQLNADMNGSTTSLNDGSAGFYRPGMKSSQSQLQKQDQHQQHVNDVPMQSFDSNGLPPLPSMDSLWDRIEHWIDEEYPEIDDYLNDGVTTADLDEFLQDLKCGSRRLPEDFRQFYKRHDGQFRGGKPTGLVMGLVLLDLESIVEENMMWNKVAERLEAQQYLAQKQQQSQQQQQQSQNLDVKEGSSGSHQHSKPSNTFISHQRSIPPNSIQPVYYHRGWIVLLKDNIGNQVAMDLCPGPNGTWGQIILFGRDFDTKLVIAINLQDFIFSFVSDLEAGNFQIDSTEYNEQLGFLSPERDGDFMIGDEDESQGELNFLDKDGAEFGLNAIRGRPGYIEILKRRALKRYGLNEKFQTVFQPQRIQKKHSNGAGKASPFMGNSPNNSTHNLGKIGSKNNSSASLATNGKNNTPPVSSPLVNLDKSSGTFSIPKETIMDGSKDAEKKPDSGVKGIKEKLENVKIDDEKKTSEQEEEIKDSKEKTPAAEKSPAVEKEEKEEKKEEMEKGMEKE
ncbi:uncharacterized protein LODBEIA_P02570 [Lodderomyces beijingensis]|uniref:Knr4/Smi1-like domain-containing protein n=1 Tax=Lodderomyces beijingensis TaxID=1775926 RepID=A0ABP0ZEN0_9ASCO